MVHDLMNMLFEFIWKQAKEKKEELEEEVSKLHEKHGVRKND